jgi:hypothetical protein
MNSKITPDPWGNTVSVEMMQYSIINRVHDIAAIRGSVSARGQPLRPPALRPGHVHQETKDYLRLSAPAVVIVMCDIVVFALEPCQCRSPALICTTSPTVTSRSSCSVATTPAPAVMTRI